MFYFYYSRQTLNSKSTKFKSFSEDRTDHYQVNYSSAETRQLINSFHTTVVRGKGISTSALQVNNPSRAKLRFQVIN